MNGFGACGACADGGFGGNLIADHNGGSSGWVVWVEIVLDLALGLG